MKKISLTIAAAFILGMMAGNMSNGVNAAISGLKFAVMNVQEVVAASNNTKALKAEVEKKNKEFQTFRDKAIADVNKQTTDEKKMELAKKYDAELAKKQNDFKQEYEKKLAVIVNDINNVVAQEAKTQGYDFVLQSSEVLYGGTNITADLVKKVK